MLRYHLGPTSKWTDQSNSLKATRLDTVKISIRLQLPARFGRFLKPLIFQMFCRMWPVKSCFWVWICENGWSHDLCLISLPNYTISHSKVWLNESQIGTKISTGSDNFLFFFFGSRFRRKFSVKVQTSDKAKVFGRFNRFNLWSAKRRFSPTDLRSHVQLAQNTGMLGTCFRFWHRHLYQASTRTKMQYDATPFGKIGRKRGDPAHQTFWRE